MAKVESLNLVNHAHFGAFRCDAATGAVGKLPNPENLKMGQMDKSAAPDLDTISRTGASPGAFGATQRQVGSDLDASIIALQSALNTLFARPAASQPCPTLPESPGVNASADAPVLSNAEKAHAGALMRINHVGEVCAQALYSAQALATENKALKAHFMKASQEETDHLAWTAERLQELGARPSLLNPLWYAGAFAMGLVAGRLGDKISLGFVEETEKQVAAHLESHLALLPQGLPQSDPASRAIVAQMRDDEAAHAREAHAMGALELPQPAKDLMRAAAKVMTTVAYRI